MLRALWRVVAIAAGVGACLVGSPASAQDAPKAKTIMIEGGTVLSMGPAGVIEGGTVSLRKGKIKSVRGAGRAGGMPNPNQVRIDASGKYVTPGLIDAWADLNVAPGGNAGTANASCRAIDGLDMFDRHDFEQALRNGVTAICVEPAATKGIVGTAALVRLADLDNIGASAETDVCLVVRLGVGKVGPFLRLKELAELRKAFKEAKEYREAWEEYEEELEAYAKDLKAGKKVKLDKKKEKAKSADGKKGKKPKGRKGRRLRPRDSSGESLMAWLEELERGNAGAAGPGAVSIGETQFCEDDEDGSDEEHATDVDDFDLRSWLDVYFSSGDGSSGGKKKDASKKADDEAKKPERPKKDRNKELLVRTLKRELAVRFEAHRPADILNVLELAGEFNLDAAVVGASGGRYVAEPLGKAESTVVLGGMIRTALFENGHYRDHDSVNAAVLSQADVAVVIGSGPGGGGNRAHYLRQNAAIAVGAGMDAEGALAAVTINAARVCGVAESLGSLEPGKTADVVVWSGHPLSSGSVVEYVFVGGKEVCRREP